MPNVGLPKNTFKKEIEKLFDRIARDTVAYIDNIEVARTIGREYQGLIQDKFLDVARIDRKRQSVLIKPPNVVIFPKKTNNGLRFYFERLRL